MQDLDNMQIIIKELKNDNLEYFDEFYDLTKKQVYFSIMSILKNKASTEDIMQDTYMRFLKNIHKYKDNTNVYAFLVTIARRLAINAYNKRKKESFYDFTQYEDTYINQSNTNTPLLNLVYQTLKGQELEVFIYHVIDELKHKEIAKIMKKPLGTITWLYSNAVKKLKERMDENETI